MDSASASAPKRATANILHKTKNERKLVVGDPDLVYSKSMSEDALYKKCEKWIPDSCSPSIIEFKIRYIRDTLKIPACKCGHPAIIRTIQKKSSPNRGREFYACVMYPPGCGFFEYVDAESARKHELSKKLKSAQLTKTDLRFAYKRGWFGDVDEDEPKAKKIRLKITHSGMRDFEFLEAKSLDLF
jgi:hypothetical protein